MEVGWWRIRTERHSKDDVVVVVDRGADGLILHSGEPWPTQREDRMHIQIQGTPCPQMRQLR